MATWVVVSGSPSVFDADEKPRPHDRAWDNFVRDPLLRARNGDWPRRRGEDVVWIVFRPGYEKRWDADLKRGADKGTNLHGAADYMGLLEKRAAEHKWRLIWITKASEIWATIAVLSEHSLTRLWYYGHARTDMWLWLRHESSGSHAAIGPDSTALWLKSSIEGSYAKYFEAAPAAYDTNRSSKFFGCNSDEFAKSWATTFKVFAEGAQGRTDYEEILKGEGVGTGCTWLKFGPDGSVLR